jgi:hypothetical protein
MPVDRQRLEELQRIHRPELFRPAYCAACDEWLNRDVDHVCDQTKVAEVERQRQYWADPGKSRREEQQQAVRDKLQPILERYHGFAPDYLRKNTSDLLDEIITAITPHLDVGGCYCWMKGTHGRQ